VQYIAHSFVKKNVIVVLDVVLLTVSLEDF